MPRDYAYCVDGQRGLGSYPRNARKLTEDAIAPADPYVDFSRYDTDVPNGIPNSGDDDGNAFEAIWDSDFEIADLAGTADAARAEFGKMPVSPNPTVSGARVLFASRSGNPAAGVYDISGRFVKNLSIAGGPIALPQHLVASTWACIWHRL